MPIGSGQTVDVEHATDAQFQAWLDASGLNDLVDDNGIPGWTFDDRVRTINFALRKGRIVPFAESKNNSNNASNNSGKELFEGDTPASEAV